MERSAILSVFVTILAITMQETSGAMTMPQLKQAARMIRKTCQPKAGVATDLLDLLDEGVFTDDRNLKCYLKCAMGMMQAMRDGKLRTDIALSMAEKLSADIKDRVIAAIQKCSSADDVASTYALAFQYKMNLPAISSVFVLVLATALHETSAGMSMDQVKQTLKMLRNVCQPKTGVSMELVEGIQAGNFPEDDNLKCYTKCVMGMMQAIKGGKYKPDAAIGQAKMLLSGDTRDRVIATMEKCRNAADGISEVCEVAFVTTKCIYEADPECFFFA
ncbi:uncharacterized protein LOC111872815 [Cryptotermes secundus]|uniref:uncharacterized protein LOC111872815 n=1 Tax=Cryptotermes secundus TaxID=105785 RepID=UPI000CD7B75A|nr:uncharacterized protein LOC111872815 [Cryptotermes secundus]